jgi:hypothetical protein
MDKYRVTLTAAERAELEHLVSAGFKILTGGVSVWLSARPAWIFRTTSMPRTTRPKAAKPWPSGLRRPPKSSSGWSPTQRKKSEVAVSGPSRAIEMVPSLCLSPVSRVRSSLIGGNSSLARAGLMPAWTTAIVTLLSGWLSARTVRWKRPPSQRLASTRCVSGDESRRIQPRPRTDADRHQHPALRPNSAAAGLRWRPLSAFRGPAHRSRSK